MDKKFEEYLKKNKCPVCGANLRIKEGKYGEFISCSRFPSCKFTTSKEKFTEWVKTKIEEKEKPVLDSQFYLKEKYELNLPKKITDLILKDINSKKGFVYFIKIKGCNLIKIGKSKDFISRLCSLNNELDGIIPIWIIKTRFYSAMEMFFHEVFRKFLKDKNEYFDIPFEYLIEVSKIKVFLGEKVEVIDKFNKPLSKALEQRKEKMKSKIREYYKNK